MDNTLCYTRISKSSTRFRPTEHFIERIIEVQLAPIGYDLLTDNTFYLISQIGDAYQVFIKINYEYKEKLHDFAYTMQEQHALIAPNS